MSERSPEQEEALAKARERAVECTVCSWGRVGTFAYVQGAKHERATGHAIVRVASPLWLPGSSRSPFSKLRTIERMVREGLITPADAMRVLG